mgnify:CR=1 FL=1
MNKQIFIINGSGQVGKDTFCNMIRDYSGYNTYIISSVDRVKEVAKKIGWDGKSKTDKDRKFLSDLKFLTTEYNDFSMNDIREKINYFNASVKKEIMFIHIREPKEIERCKQEFSAKTILITNKNVEHIISNEADAGVFEYLYDFYIHNDGSLEELKEKALNFIERIIGENSNENKN